MTPIKILTVSSLYPNSEVPHFGVFVENRLKRIVATGKVSASVIAPVPWFPFKSSAFGPYAQFARVSRHDQRAGLAISHPRYLVVPKVGMRYTPHFYAQTLLNEIRRLGQDFDLIDAHYFYPDGVAAAQVARQLNKPLVITARGTDLNLIPKIPYARRAIIEAIDTAGAVIGVSAALAALAMELRRSDTRIEVLRNGVDLSHFAQRDREKTRTELGVTGPLILSVANLIENKGHHLVIDAMKLLPNVQLAICGEGPFEGRLRAQVQNLQLTDRIRFLGRIKHSDLARYYSAADALALMPAVEGYPNVVLEALACGTPVVATAAGGIPEIVTAPEAGRLVERREPRAIADSLASLLSNPPAREATRSFAEQFGWETTVERQIQLYQDVIRAAPRVVRS